jgi:hypothetical protein
VLVSGFNLTSECDRIQVLSDPKGRQGGKMAYVRGDEVKMLSTRCFFQVPTRKRVGMLGRRIF